MRENLLDLETFADMEMPTLISSKKDLCRLQLIIMFFFLSRSEKLILTFCASLNDLLATYSWKRKKIK